MTRYHLLGLAVLIASPGLAQSADNDLKPVAEIKLNATVSALLPSKDGKHIYFMNKSDGKIQRIDVARKALDATDVELVEGAESFALSPDGKTIYVSASPNGHNAYSGSDKEVGKIQVIDVEKMAVTSTFSMKFDPFEIAATDDGKVYAAGGSNQHTKLAVIDVKKKSIVGDVGGLYMKSNMRMTPDGKRLYCSSNGLSPGSMNGTWLGEKGKPGMSHGAGGGPFDITPDGKFVVFQSGMVSRLGKSPTEDLKEAGKVKPNLGFALDVGAKTVWLATREGELQKVSYPDFELQETFVLPKRAYQLYLHPKTKLLFAALDNKKDRGINDTGGVGNIAIFELKMKD